MSDQLTPMTEQMRRLCRENVRRLKDQRQRLYVSLLDLAGDASPADTAAQSRATGFCCNKGDLQS